MTKRQKILTMVALVAFGVIMLLHYVNLSWYYSHANYGFTSPMKNYEGHLVWTHGLPILPVVNGFLLVIAVFYAGLFAMLGGESKPKEPKPETSKEDLRSFQWPLVGFSRGVVTLWAMIMLLILGTLGTYLLSLLAQ